MMLTYYANEMEEFQEVLGQLAAVNSLSFIFRIVSWVLMSLGLYTVAKRRGIHHAWLSWIPVGDMWILGSLSDQYRWVAKHQVKSKRKALMTLTIILAVLIVLLIVVSASTTFKVIAMAAGATEEEIMETVIGPILTVMLSILPMLGVAIAIAVIQYMALYDLYCSTNPENAVLFLVLGIFLSFTTPFFVFFNRKSDSGMRPQNAIPGGYGQPGANSQNPCQQNPCQQNPYQQNPYQAPQYQPPQPEAPQDQPPQNPDASRPEQQPWDNEKL